MTPAAFIITAVESRAASGLFGNICEVSPRRSPQQPVASDPLCCCSLFLRGPLEEL